LREKARAFLSFPSPRLCELSSGSKAREVRTHTWTSGSQAALNVLVSWCFRALDLIREMVGLIELDQTAASVMKCMLLSLIVAHEIVGIFIFCERSLLSTKFELDVSQVSWCSGRYEGILFGVSIM